jgi:hypothetical protein
MRDDQYRSEAIERLRRSHIVKSAEMIPIRWISDLLFCAGSAIGLGRAECPCREFLERNVLRERTTRRVTPQATVYAIYLLALVSPSSSLRYLSCALLVSTDYDSPRPARTPHKGTHRRWAQRLTGESHGSSWKFEHGPSIMRRQRCRSSNRTFNWHSGDVKPLRDTWQD